MSNPVVDVAKNTVSFEGTDYNVQPLGDDSFTLLIAGVPVGKLVYTFGAANGVPQGDKISEEKLTAIAEAWFAAIESQ